MLEQHQLAFRWCFMLCTTPSMSWLGRPLMTTHPQECADIQDSPVPLLCYASACVQVQSFTTSATQTSRLQFQLRSAQDRANLAYNIAVSLASSAWCGLSLVCTGQFLPKCADVSWRSMHASPLPGGAASSCAGHHTLLS
jgi:hypothetical protein